MRRIWLGLLLVACSGSRSTSHSPLDSSRDAGRIEQDGSVDSPAQSTDSTTAVTADAGVPSKPKPETEGGVAAPLGSDYRTQGPFGVAAKIGRFEGRACSFAYEIFTPSSLKSRVRIVLAPGFNIGFAGSTREAMGKLATQMASWGIATLTVDLCTNGAAIDHAKNGAALAEFGTKVGGDRVIYAGFSAGGLATLIAAAQSSNTEAVLALDAVDTNGLALAALDTIKQPVQALVGEPSQCNSQQNMLAVYQGRALPVVKVNDAQHFTFEGSVCEGFKCVACPGGEEGQAKAVRALATSHVVGIAGIDANALSWWREGSPGFRALSEDAVLSRVQ